tara:strand:- start:1086 stop:1598 length:513 start_codon:yes stop_codon:yes gene_type:complete
MKTVKKNKNQKKPTKIQDLTKKNQDLSNQVDKKNDELLRSIADFENLKKRKNNEISNLLRYSGEELIKNLIPVFNDLDRILIESKKIKDVSKIVEGIELVNNKLYNTLNNLSIIKFDSLGESFDPEFHDAIMMRKSKNEKNIIVEEFEKGYKYHDKIIKHAKVIVSEGKK